MFLLDFTSSSISSKKVDTYDKYFKDVDHFDSAHHRVGRDDGNLTLKELTNRRKSFRHKNDETNFLDDLLMKDKDGKYVNFATADTDENGKLSEGELLRYLIKKRWAGYIR